MKKFHHIMSEWLNHFSLDIQAAAAKVSSETPFRGIMEALENRTLLSASISGTVYNDLNANGVRNTGEPGIASVVVYVDLNGNGIFASTDPHTTTNALGAYTITALANGSYTVRQTLASGEVQSAPAGGTGQSVTITNANVGGIDFGDYRPPSSFLISGTVFNDANNNGVFDSGERGIANVQMYVDTNNDGSFESTEPHAFTNASGNYSIQVFTPGTYLVRQVQPANTVQTDPVNNAGVHVTLATANVAGINFGDSTADGTVTEADMNVISGTAFDPTNDNTTMEVKFVISGGPTQIIQADQANHGFTYTTPVLSVGAHTVQIYTINPGTNATTLLATRTVTSQNSLFDEHYYLARYPDVAAAVRAGAIGSGYDHYIQYGQYEGRSPSPYWNETFYLQENPDVAAQVRARTETSGFMQFYLIGQRQNRPGLLYFNNNYYLAAYPDVAAAVNSGAIASGFEHYILYGQYEGRSPMKYFSSSVYDSNNSDILDQDTGDTFSSDFEQFVEVAQFQGRIGSNFYNEQVYLADNTDVAAAVNAGTFRDGFIHWLEYGQFEHRTAV
jgi:hypothetical protein